MEFLNRVELTGLVGTYKEIKVMDQVKGARFTLRTDMAYKNQDGQAVIETTWHNVVAFRGTAKRMDLDKLEAAVRDHKFVHVIGHLKNMIYTSAEGTDYHTTDILPTLSSSTTDVISDIVRITYICSMITDDFKHDAGAFLSSQADKLLSAQASVASQTYNQRTGMLSSALNSSSTAKLGPDGMSIELDFPMHIRFLDMKKGANGKKKKTYAPIYNKYVYGYLRSGVWKWLNAHLPGVIARSFKETFKDIRE